MPICTNVQTFTDQELLNLCRKQIAELLVGGQAVGQNGNHLTRADLPQLRETEQWLEARINASDPTCAGGIALVRIGNPQ